MLYKNRLDKLIEDATQLQTLMSGINFRKLPKILKVSVKSIYKHNNKALKILNKNYDKYLLGDYDYDMYLQIQTFEDIICQAMEFKGLIIKLAEIK